MASTFPPITIYLGVIHYCSLIEMGIPSISLNVAPVCILCNVVPSYILYWQKVKFLSVNFTTMHVLFVVPQRLIREEWEALQQREREEEERREKAKREKEVTVCVRKSP